MAMWTLLSGNVYLNTQDINTQDVLEIYTFDITKTPPGAKEPIFHRDVFSQESILGSRAKMISRISQLFVIYDTRDIRTHIFRWITWYVYLRPPKPHYLWRRAFVFYWLRSQQKVTIMFSDDVGSLLLTNQLWVTSIIPCGMHYSSNHELTSRKDGLVKLPLKLWYG